jgi:acetolactate synthase-1/2/3 large subunit
VATVAEYVIERLARAGITHCFTLYGGAISDLIDALPGRMKYVVGQHEQACGFMAEGMAKASGKPGLVIATSGPGGGNLVTPLQNAYYDSVPLIAITGQVSTAFRRPPASALRQLGFQETPIAEIVRPITKFAHTPTTAEGAIHALEEALYLATHQRPGPVLLDLPVDVQRLQVDAGAQRAVHPEDYPDPAGAAAAFLSDLERAQRPGILVGGGAFRAAQAIRAFAHKHAIPVFRTWNALDIIPDDHPCYAGTVGTYGGPGRNFGIQNTDLLLVLGCRLSGRITGGVPESFARGAKLYVVDVDAGLLDPTYQPRKADVNVHCSAERFLDELA